jgi:uridine phosphorylase
MNGTIEKEYAPHLKCSRKDIGRYIIFHDNIDWVEKIVKHLSDGQLISHKREYYVYTGWLHDERVTVVSTGMGAPSTALALDELAMIGAEKFFKIGTCGALQDDLNHGDVIIPTGAVRHEGTTKTYVVTDFPAVPSYPLVKKIEKSLSDAHITVKFGIIWSTDGYHSVMAQPDLFEYWSRKGVLGVEMECSSLFVTGYLRGVDAAAVTVVNRSYSQIRGLMEGEGTWYERRDKVEMSVETVVDAVLKVIKEDK